MQRVWNERDRRRDGVRIHGQYVPDPQPALPPSLAWLGGAQPNQKTAQVPDWVDDKKRACI